MSAVHGRALWRGLALAIIGSVAFSAKAIIIKLAYRHGVDAVTLIMYRMLFALPIFALMAWWASRGKPPLKPSPATPHQSSFLDFAGLSYISASLERLILYLNPTIVLVLGWLLFKKRITQRQGVADRKSVV